MKIKMSLLEIPLRSKHSTAEGFSYSERTAGKGVFVVSIPDSSN